jgi:two-component system chemotaxis response regulator CheY
MLKKIMVVDDSSLIHKMYQLVMSRYQCEIVSAMNGAEAFEKLSMHQDIELILLDINMPIMNGLQFMEKAAAAMIPKRIPIIIISTEGSEDDTLRGLKLGAKGYLKKPFYPASLHSLIDGLFDCQKLSSLTLAAN